MPGQGVADEADKPETVSSQGRRAFRGKRPEFFETPGVDHALSMIMVLVQEFCVLRDRQETMERIAAKKGLFLADEIETYTLDADELKAREERRTEFFKRVFHLMQQEIEEQTAAAK